MAADNKFQKRSHSGRKENIRNERQTTETEEPKLVFKFKDFDDTQKIGQSFEDWQKNEILSILMKRFQQLSQKTLKEAKTDGSVKFYDKFPSVSEFMYPKHIAPDVRWGVIKQITGQKARVVGYIIDNVFYIVFLDMDHKFWPTKKKRT